MKEKENIFRKKSLNKLASPESINDYIKVSNPGIWIAMLAITVILVGGILWGIFGKLDTIITAPVVSNNGKTFVLLSQKQAYNVEKGQIIHINDQTGTITDVDPDQFTSKDSVEGADMQEFVSMVEGPVVFLASCDIELDEGLYEGKIVIESINPISLLWE